MLYWAIFVLAVGLATFVILYFHDREKRHKAEIEADRLRLRFGGVIDAEAERKKVESELAQARKSSAELQSRIQIQQANFQKLEEEENLITIAFYKPHYAFSESAQYKHRLDEIEHRQKEIIKENRAATCSTEWTVDGSKSEGKKQTNQLLKLMLRAFNAECDAAIAKVKFSNIKVMEARITKAFEAINGLAERQHCALTTEYLNARMEELYLSFEYEEKVQAEKEEQRRIKEQIREEEKALREIEKAKQQAEDEERRYEAALAKARDEAHAAAGAVQEKLNAQIAALEQKLTEAQANKERAISRAQLVRSGHVYIISNVGSFGEHVFKIGMTRRLEPMDRVKELGDASVPFEFDVHAIIYSEDAPALENELHKAFTMRRVNRINERKEFFRVSIEEIAELVQKQCGEIQFTRLALAEEFRKTQALLKDEQTSSLNFVSVDGSGRSAIERA